MPALSLRYSEAAARDLERIQAYISEVEGLPSTAAEFIGSIRRRCLLLCDFPHVGWSYEHLRSGLRILPFSSVVIVFEITSQSVRVRRIFSQRQDYRRHLTR